MFFPGMLGKIEKIGHIDILRYWIYFGIGYTSVVINGQRKL